ncbi:expressed unknown protein [Seminavis robusta]|uniref:Uncharacterized protein n=1 Tax=Seminavis robusta TaxID=568900 RepID=A0A9N8H984_9STRA|nr:expressed unknown protein [Seminavis robusta]|eukprot:Sro267_g103320.1 n/a (255) ;mRNA; r:13965-14729
MSSPNEMESLDQHIVEAASRMVEKIVEVVNNQEQEADPLGMTVDAMIRQVAVLLEKQKEFYSWQASTKVDIGYHWTSPDNLKSIRAHGLLTRAELQARKITPKTTHGTVHGDGIYTAFGPISSFEKYGSQCFMVARLQGVSMSVDPYINETQLSSAVNSVLAGYTCVLKSSWQCVPLMTFTRPVEDWDKIHQCHVNHRHSFQPDSFQPDRAADRRTGLDHGYRLRCPRNPLQVRQEPNGHLCQKGQTKSIPRAV